MNPIELTRSRLVKRFGCHNSDCARPTRDAFTHAVQPPTGGHFAETTIANDDTYLVDFNFVEARDFASVNALPAVVPAVASVTEHLVPCPTAWLRAKSDFTKANFP